MVNGVSANSFREAALLHGLLEADNSIELCLNEATSYQMPLALRRLFVTILIYCNPIDARALWKKFQKPMCEDYMRLPGFTEQKALQTALEDISYQLKSMGKNINDYSLIESEFRVEESEQRSKEIDEELKIPVPAEDLESIKKLNTEQKNAYNVILETVLNNRSGAFFVDGPSGTGKTYLYRALLAFLRSRGHIALAIASSGVTASILPGGRTAHSRFKIHLNLSENVVCGVRKQSGLAKLFNATRLIIWDEAPMVSKQAIEAFDQMLRDICECNICFGGKVVVFGGDFRQVLPVLPTAAMQQVIDNCLVKSNLWFSLEKIKLSENMRAKSDGHFSEYLLKIGDGTETFVIDDQIKIPTSMAIRYSDGQSLNDLIHETFPSMLDYARNIDSMINRAILAPRNDCVSDINNMLIDEMHGNVTEYKSYDRPIDSMQQGFQEDFFNVLMPSGFPPHILRLKPNCPIILLRNIEPSKGMCNGTRLICKSFEPNMIHAIIVVGHHKGKEVLLPRIPFSPTENENVVFPFQRTQFPIRLSFAMIINKAQGQTFDFVGVYLPQPVFCRAKNSKSVKILIVPSHDQEIHEICIQNVVYQEVLHLAN